MSNRGAGTVSVIDTADNAIVASVRTTGDPSDNPVGIAITPDGGQAYVTNRGSATVGVVDTATATLPARIGVQGGPNGVAVSPDGRHPCVPGGMRTPSW